MIDFLKKIKRILLSKKNERNNYKYKFVSKAIKRYNWRLHSRRYSPWENEEYNDIIKRGNYSFNDKKFMIYQLAKGVSKMHGDTAECGVFKGYGSWLILNANKDEKFTHHMFDSFEGISEPIDIDNSKKSGIYQWKKNDMSFPMEKLKNKFKAYSNVKYYKGWIPSKFNEVKNCTFKFVHIDVDLYEPTLDSFKFFYDKTIPGGVILCDDYAAEGTPGAYKAVNEFLRDKKENIITTVPGSGFIIKQ